MLTCPRGDARACLEVAQKNLATAVQVEGKIEEEAAPAKEAFRKARQQLADVCSRLARAKEHVKRCKNEMYIAQNEYDATYNTGAVKANLMTRFSDWKTDQIMGSEFDDDVSDDMLSQIDLGGFQGK